MFEFSGNNFVSVNSEQGISIDNFFDQIISKIEFKGSGNLIYFGPRMRPNPKTNIIFYGKNALVYFGGDSSLNILIEIYTNNLLFVGPGVGTGGIFDPVTTFRLLESKNIIIGAEVMFGRGAYLRNADGHILYDRQSFERINPSKSIIIGDRAWIGQYALISKGSFIGSGAMIGAGSIVSNKSIPDDCIWVGPPGKVIKENILIDRTATAYFTDIETEKYQKYQKPDKFPKLIGIDTLKRIDEIDPNLTVNEKLISINKLID